MKLENALTIPVPAAEAWRVLLDVERIAPCVPGATLTAKDGDAYTGRIKVKLGPIALTYTGTITFLAQDEATGVVVLEASGREMRGNGTAKAVITCHLVGSGDNTRVLIETELAITGKPAQFGRSTLADVAGALVDRFAANLAEELAAAAPPTPNPRTTERDVTARPATLPRPTAEPMDLLQAAGAGEVFKRYAPTALAAAVFLAVLCARRRRVDTHPRTRHFVASGPHNKK